MNQAAADKATPQAESASELVARWLAAVNAALESASVERVAALFAPDGHWRDVLAFTWTLTTAERAQDIAALIVARQATTKARGFALAEGHAAPRVLSRAGISVIEGIFQFETEVGRGLGVVRLRAEPVAPGRE